MRTIINRGLRKGVRRGLGMKKYKSVTDRFGDKFKEAEERTRN